MTRIIKKISVYTINSESTSAKEHQEERNENDEDYVTKCTGSFGVFQAKVCTVAGLSRFIIIWNILTTIFLTASTEFSCVEFEGNTTKEVKNSTCYKDCVKYEFQQEVFESTVTSQFGLICDNAWLATLTQTILILGLFIGGWVNGWISDRFGRRIGFRISIFFTIIFMLVSPFSPNYWTFCCLQFLIGSSTGGILTVTSVYILEITGSKHREVAGCFTVLPDGIAEALLPVFAYLSPTWNVYVLAYWTVSVLIFLLVLTLPESPRWLVSKRRIDKAVELITYAANCNKLSTTNIDEFVRKAAENIKLKEENDKKWSYLDLFRTKHILLKVVCMFFIFIAVGILSFGLNLYVPNIGSNIYLDVALLGLIQVPSSILSILFNKYIPRRSAVMATFAVTGLSMIALAFVPNGHWASTVFGVIGMSASTISIIVIYIYISELFPTPLRNMAFGLTSAGSKIGAMIAPFVITINPRWVPAVILSTVPFIASVFCILLPETKGQNLKDTVK